MLSWAIGFFILALVAAFFGFGGIASSAAGIAKVHGHWSAQRGASPLVTLFVKAP